MKRMVLAVLAAAALAGCVAVPYEPAPYYSAPAYYYPAPAVGVYYSSRPYYHRHWRRY